MAARREFIPHGSHFYMYLCGFLLKKSVLLILFDFINGINIKAFSGAWQIFDQIKNRLLHMVPEAQRSYHHTVNLLLLQDNESDRFPDHRRTPDAV